MQRVISLERRLALRIFALLIWTSCLFARQTSGVIEHFPVVTGAENTAIEINARLSLSSGAPVYVRVYFKSVSDQKYRFATLEQSGSQYSGQIPAAAIKGPAVQYFIAALFSNQRVVTAPISNPYNQPFEIAVRRRSQSGAPGGPNPPAVISSQRERNTNRPAQALSQVQILSPEPLEEVAPEEVVIAVGLNGAPQQVDPASVRIKVGQRDYTRSAKVSEFMVTLSPKAVRPGEYSVSVTATSVSGEPLPPANWRFTVRDPSKKQKTRNGPKPYNGRVYTEFRQEKFSGRKLSANSIGGNISGKHKSLNYNSQVFVTSLDDPQFQTRNRFSLNLTQKYFNLGFGDVYPFYNEFMLWGRRVRGFDAGVRGGFIEFQYATGQTDRRIAPVLDSTGAVLRAGTFAQDLQIGRIGFFAKKNFNLGFTLLKVKDDTSSLNLASSGRTPRDNLVTGADFRLALDKKRIEIKASTAFSLLTQDISNGPATAADIESQFEFDVPIDPADYESWLIINETTTPLDPSGLTSVAWNGSVRLNYLGNFLTIGYKRLGGQYTSLGQTYLRNNVKGLYITDRISLFRNKVFAQLGLERFKDNFSPDDSNPLVNRTNFNYGIAIYPGRKYPTINIGLRDYTRDNGVTDFTFLGSALTAPDTLDNREQSLMRNFTLNLSQSVSFLNQRHTLSYFLINSELIDELSTTRLSPIDSRDYSSFVQTFALKTDFNERVSTVLTYGMNESTSNQIDNLTSLSESQFNIFSGRVELKFLQGDAMVYGGARAVSSDGLLRSDATTIVSAIDFSQTSFQFGGSLTVQEKHRFSFDADIINFTDNGGLVDANFQVIANNPSYKNSIVRFFYQYRL